MEPRIIGLSFFVEMSADDLLYHSANTLWDGFLKTTIISSPEWEQTAKEAQNPAVSRSPPLVCEEQSTNAARLWLAVPL